eukprot:1157352-Pelagomonas_calceolata.AAC.1
MVVQTCNVFPQALCQGSMRTYQVWKGKIPEVITKQDIDGTHAQWLQHTTSKATKATDLQEVIAQNVRCLVEHLLGCRHLSH